MLVRFNRTSDLDLKIVFCCQKLEFDFESRSLFSKSGVWSFRKSEFDNTVVGVCFQKSDG